MARMFHGGQPRCGSKSELTWEPLPGDQLVTGFGWGEGESWSVDGKAWLLRSWRSPGGMLPEWQVKSKAGTGRKKCRPESA